MRVLTAVALAGLLAACGPGSRETRPPDDTVPVDDTVMSVPLPDYRRMADSLDRADVVRAVDLALSRGDRRLLGVMGYVLIVPAVPRDQEVELREKHGVRVLDHTSDAMHGEDHAAWNASAARYAERYNRELLRRRIPPTT